jgi:zinc protease
MQDPDKVAAQEWFKLAFAGHPYGTPNQGTLESVPTITAEDLKTYTARNLARDNLKLAVVGDITADELKKDLDEVFGALPEKAQLAPVPEVTWPEGYKRKIVEMANPQSVAQFGFRGLKRADPDFIPAYILNYIIGGGGFASKLMQEVREKRGLAYSVYTYLYPLDHTGIFAGGVATENKEVGQSLDVIRSELDRIARDGPTEEELRAAKDYLTGSFALRFDTSTKIAAQLLTLQLENLGMDYLDKRNGLIEAVTMDDMKRVAKRVLSGDKDLIVTVVGQPDGMTNVGLTN